MTGRRPASDGNTNALRHGHKREKASPTYLSWRSMRNRVRGYSKNACYSSVTHDPRWESFDKFLEDMGERPFGAVLHRTFDSGNYTPDNCIWLPRTTSNKFCKSKYQLFQGRYRNRAEIAAVLGMSYVKFSKWIRGVNRARKLAGLQPV